MSVILVLSLTMVFLSAEEQASWSCDFVGSYHSLRPTNCCFSADGSLLAVSFGEVVTVWSVDTWGLLTTLCQPPGAIRWGPKSNHTTLMASRCEKYRCSVLRVTVYWFSLYYFYRTEQAH